MSKRISCVNEYKLAMKTNNWTFMEPILWNKKTKKLYCKCRFIQNPADSEKDQQASVMNYVKAKLARYFGTYKWLIDIIQDTTELLVIQIQGQAIPKSETCPTGGWTSDPDKFELTFQKSLLPKLLNETIYPA